MDRSRFTGIFSRKRRPSSDEKINKRNEISRSHESFLESEGFLSPPNSTPLPSALRRPSTPLSRFAATRTSSALPNQAANSSEEKSRISSSTYERPRKSFSGLSRQTLDSVLTATTSSTKQKTGFFPFGRVGGEVSDEELKNNAWVEEHAHTDRPTSSWLRRCMGSTRGAQRRPHTPVTSLLAYSDPRYHDSHLPAPIPDFGIVPGLGHEQMGQRPNQSSGAAARAAAAAQNELLESMRNVKLVDAHVSHDSESGIGIERADTLLDLTVPVIRQSMCDDIIRISCMLTLISDPVSVLPPELMAHILAYLDATSLQKSELVSRDWNQVASSHPVWRQVFWAEFLGANGLGNVNDRSLPGYPAGKPRQDWKCMWRARKALNQRWVDGHAAAIYLEGHTDSVYCVQFDRDKILTGSRDRTVRIWDARTYECIKVLGVPTRASPVNRQPLPMESSDRGQKPFLRVFPNYENTVTRPGMISLYHSGSILCLQYDDEIMVTGSSDCTLMIWDVEAHYTPIRRLRHHTAGVLDVCFDDKHIVSCSKDTTICLWDRRGGNFLRRLSGHNGPVNAVQLRGDLVVSASGDGIAKLWNLTSGLCIKEFPSKKRGMACVEFSLDSRTILAGGNDQVIYQFDTNTGELVRELKGHGNLVRSLHLDSDSGRIVSGSYDFSVRAFNLHNGEPIVNLVNWTSSWILSAKADYRRIVATSQDSRAVIIDFGYQLPGIESLEI